ncbi:MAG TPA: hypothetical protein VK327_02350 [Candidatus Paceibacterota bacterium]|nr:hypothetical protein [Candidatus Paceibacterota bacterium]
MSKKEYFLIGVVVVLAGLYAVFFSDWFKPKFIRIEHTVRSSREAWGGNGRVKPAFKDAGGITFSLHNPYKLTCVRVFVAAELETNKFAHPVWHLVSKKGSEPADGFAYGFQIPGMTSAVPGAEPDALQPGVDYRLVVEAGSLKGTNTFKLDRQVSSRG